MDETKDRLKKSALGMSAVSNKDFVLQERLR